MSKRETPSCLNEGVWGETIIHPGSGEKRVSGTAFPRRERRRSPEIHRLIVLQMLDLNSCVSNQDCGKQQQKLVYRALLRSDGNLWGGGASRVQAPFWTLRHPEESSWRQKVTVIKSSTWHPVAFLFIRGIISICSCPTAGLTPYATWGPLLKHHAMLGKRPLPQTLCTWSVARPLCNLAK